ncbi:MAG: hypothetical protein ACRDAM_07215 [Casimicrobium sp.]
MNTRPIIKGVYEESAWVAKVLVIDDRSNDVFECYTLQVLEHMSLIEGAYAPTIGTQFTYSRKRDASWATMGQLTLDAEVSASLESASNLERRAHLA